MSHALLRDARLYVALLKIDRDIAEQARAKGCCAVGRVAAGQCGGVLHTANYPRKPRGGPRGLPAEYDWRFSFCCAREGCRKRATPESVRFLGRRVYLGAVVLVATAMRHGLTPRRVRKLEELLGVSRRTLERWRQWWLELFPRTHFWKATKSRFMPPVNASQMPASLLERFDGDERGRLIAAMKFLRPLSTSTVTEYCGQDI